MVMMLWKKQRKVYDFEFEYEQEVIHEIFFDDYLGLLLNEND
jgi:hypothetical protein